MGSTPPVSTRQEADPFRADICISGRSPPDHHRVVLVEAEEDLARVEAQSAHLEPLQRRVGVTFVHCVSAIERRAHVFDR